ncbi:MAG: hypothetical protein V3T40_04135 [Nitrososphaerales archaeon]
MKQTVKAVIGGGILVLSIIIGPLSISASAAFGIMIDSPRKQVVDGILPEDVVCKPGLTLMLRSSGTAACVKPSNSMKLVGRGWGIILKEPSIREEKAEHPSTSPILVFVDYTSHTVEDDADGIAIVDLNPDSSSFGQILQEVPIGPRVNPHHLYYNRDGSKLYTTALGGPIIQASLFLIEMNGDRINQVLPIDTGPCKVAEDLYFSEDGTRFYMTCMGSDMVIIYEEDTYNLIGQIKASKDKADDEPYIRYPHGIHASEKIDRMVITETISAMLDDPGSSVSVVEFSSGKVLSTLPVTKDRNNSGAPVEVLFHPDLPVAYITGMLESSLWTLIWDPVSETFNPELVDDGTSRNHSWPLGLYLGPDGNLYVSWAKPGVVNVYSLKKPDVPELVRTLPAEPGAHHIAFSKDGRYMFVQNNLLTLEGMNSGTISVVDLESGELVATVDSFIKRGWQPESLLLLE